VGVCPRAVKPRARVQRLMKTVFFILVFGYEMQPGLRLDSAFLVDFSPNPPARREMAEFRFVFARRSS